MEFEYSAGQVLVAGALAPGNGQDVGEPDRVGAVLRGGGNPQFERGVLAGDNGFTRLDPLGIDLAAGTGGTFQGRRQWWAHIGAEQVAVVEAEHMVMGAFQAAIS